MKKLLIALAAVIVSVATYAQGTVSFNTRIPGAVDAPVSLGDASGPGPGDKWSAGLWLVGAGGALTPIPSSVTTFRTVPAGGNALLAKYVNTVGTVEIPGVATGGSATLRMRAWETAAGSFDAAGSGTAAAGNFARRAESADVIVAGLGGGPTPPANLTGLQGFVIPPVPEPTTLALGALGAAALLIRRRK
jgi:hypothetical protein